MAGEEPPVSTGMLKPSFEEEDEDVLEPSVCAHRYAGARIGVNAGTFSSCGVEKTVSCATDGVLLCTVNIAGRGNSVVTRFVIDGESNNEWQNVSAHTAYLGHNGMIAVNVKGGTHTVEVQARGSAAIEATESDWQTFTLHVAFLPMAKATTVHANAFTLSRENTWGEYTGLRVDVDVRDGGKAATGKSPFGAGAGAGAATAAGAGAGSGTTTGAGLPPGCSATAIASGGNATVIVFYALSISGNPESHLVTRMTSGDRIMPGTRSITGNTPTWHNHGLWAGEIPVGHHEFVTEYRTPARHNFRAANGNHASMCVITIPPGTATVQRVFTATGNYALNGSNGWGKVPGMTARFSTVPETPTIVHFGICGNGHNSHLVTRLDVDGRPDVRSRGICGNRQYWGVNGVWMGDMGLGEHNVSIEYRTPAACTVAVQDNAGWQDMCLTVITLHGDPPEPESTLKEDFGSMLGDTDISDVTFVVEDQEVPAHRAILAARSPVFRAMFSRRTGMRESDPRGATLPLAEVKHAPFLVLLRFLYTDDLVIGTECDPMEVREVASRFDCPRLAKMCEQFVYTNLSDSNCVLLMTSAEYHKAGRLRKRCEHYIVENWKTVSKNKESMTQLKELSKDTLWRIMTRLK